MEMASATLKELELEVESEPQLVVWLEMARVLELEAGLEPRLVGLLERRKVPTMERKEKSIS